MKQTNFTACQTASTKKTSLMAISTEQKSQEIHLNIYINPIEMRVVRNANGCGQIAVVEQNACKSASLTEK